MSRVIMFSRKIPKYHINACDPTYFVEQIWNGFNLKALGEEFIALKEDDLVDLNKHLPYHLVDQFKKSLRPRLNYNSKKYHTVRSGFRWKAGDKFSPRVWAGDPYKSKQIIIAEDILITNVYDLRITSKWEFILNNKILNNDDLHVVAKNDGLTMLDFLYWFQKAPFIGQVICWNNTINY